MRYASEEINETISRLNTLWIELKAASEADGEVPCDTPLCDEFIEAVQQTRPLTDELLTRRNTKPAS